MATKVYVGNLPYNFTAQDLQKLFEAFGPVRSAEVIFDKMTGRSRGFGFVEMESAEGVAAAIAGLHDKPVAGRNLTVNEARERERAPRSFGAPAGGGGGFRPGAPRPGGGGGGPSSGFGPNSSPRRESWSNKGGGRPKMDGERGRERSWERSWQREEAEDAGPRGGRKPRDEGDDEE